MELIQHILGICPDAASHIDILDLIFSNIPLQDFIQSFQLFFKKSN